MPEVTLAMNPRAIPPAVHVATRWAARRTFAVDRIPSNESLCEHKHSRELRIDVAIPASNDEKTIGTVCEAVRRDLMADVPLIDRLIVLDIGSDDDTVVRARSGVHVVDVGRLMPEVPLYPGEGDVLWRSLAATSADILVWIDPDVRDFRSDVVARLVAPLLVDPGVSFVKGYFQQPGEIDIEIDNVVYLAGRGGVTELLVRPLLNIFFPELGGFFQPLGRFSAGRVDVLRRIPFLSGCSVDVGTLVYLFDELGLDGMAQVDLGLINGSPTSLDVLGPRAHAIARAILKLAHERNRVRLAPTTPAHPLLRPHDRNVDPVRIDEIERPPIDVVPPYLAALRTNQDGVARSNGGVNCRV